MHAVDAVALCISSFGAQAYLDWRYSRSFGIFKAPFAIVANEMKIITSSLLLSKTVTLAMLPDIAIVAGNTVGAVVLIQISNAAKS